MIKTCPRCQLVKTSDQFGVDHTTADKLTAYCLSCKSILNAEYYANHRAQISAQRRKRREARKGTSRGWRHL